MKTTDSRFPNPTARRSGRYSEHRSVGDSLLEALGQTGMRPRLDEPAPGRGRRRGQRLMAVTALAAVAALGFTFLRSSDGAQPVLETVAMTELARGSVWHSPAALAATPRPESRGFVTLASGQPIHAGAVIETRLPTGPATGEEAAKSRAALRLAGGPSLRLDAGTRVRVASSSSLVLERGTVYVDSGGDQSVEIRTTLGVVRDIGTQFEVHLTGGLAQAPALRIRVREGEVLWKHGEESAHGMAGEELRYDGAGAIDRATVPRHGPVWNWVMDTAPAPDVDGQPLDTFLAWVSREGGWRVQFEDERAERLASTTVLHGDIRGLSPIEASNMVLNGSGLEHRLEDGTFWITSETQVSAAHVTAGP